MAPKTLRYSILPPHPTHRRLLCTDCSPARRHFSLFSLVCTSLFSFNQMMQQKKKKRKQGQRRDVNNAMCGEKKERQCVNSGGGICRHLRAPSPPPQRSLRLTPTTPILSLSPAEEVPGQCVIGIQPLSEPMQSPVSGIREETSLSGFPR